MRGIECFIDTNVLVYAVSTLPEEAGKAAVAREILEVRDWAWSAQVAAEFVNVSTSAKRAQRLSLPEAEIWIDTWLAFPLAFIDAYTVKEAIRIAAHSKISYFDAQIVAAAKRLGCSTIYSEDLNDGQDYGGVRVVNPFRELSAKT
jgi:predicted nucleic acid-binding protein